MASVRVAVRVRPLSGKELDAGANSIISIHGNTLSITNVKVDGAGEYGDSSRDRVKHFTFDYCYDCSVDRGPHAHYASQELVYQDLGTEVLQAASDGYNACLFAYGQTGTGKTFTMMGYPGEIGLTPRICEGLFGYVSERQEESVTFQVQISYMEIYNERVRDLLKVSSTHPERFTLRVREHPKEGPYVEDLSRHEVKDFNEVQTVLDRGNQNRTTAATHMHEHSSRSHAIVTLHFTQAKLENGLPSEVVSKIHLVDLAGSERADPNYHKGRITEGASINKSLNTLANVIKALAERSLLAWSTETLGSATSCTNVGDPQPESPKVPSGRKSRPLYVPYRDSVLTWILKDSLGGNSKTLMIATVTPASKYYNETISTLRYAQRAKRIVNKPVVNEDANVSLIRQLRQEIERLKQLLASATGSSSPTPPLNEILYLMPGMEKFLPYLTDMEAEEGGAGQVQQDPGTLLSEKLKENEAMANKLTQSWLNKWNETHSLMKESDLSIRGLGGRSNSYGVIIDSQLPHLIGMDDDILSTGVIIFHLKEGKTLIGREDARREQDIVLEGPGIQAEHCHIEHEDGQVVLHPRQGAPCTLNGVLVNQPTALTQGDVLLLGQTIMYRFNNPAQAAKMRQHRQDMLSASQQDIQSLSAASSVTSLPDLQASRVPPLRMFNPNLESAQICLELEHKYANEAERIQHARTQLARVRAEVSEREEQDQEEEERLWEEHDQHWQQLQAERIDLTRLRERLLSSEEQAQELAQQQRQELDQEDQLYKEQLQERLGQLTQNKGDDSVSHQTGESADTAAETAEDDDGSPSAAPASPVITGPAGQELRQRRSSLEGKIKGLAQSELLHSFKRRQAMESLQQRVAEVEEEIGQSRREVETRSHKVRQMEEQFRDADASKLDRIRREKERLEELHRQEEQLELYLEEKQDLLAVGQALPKPLRGACSELSLLRQDSASGGFSVGTVRTANSEANIEQCQDDLDMGSLHSSSTSSRDSQDDSSGRLHSSGFLSGSAERFGRSQSLDDALVVGFEGDGGGDLSWSVGSDMGSEESLSSSVDMSSSSSTSRQSGNQRVGEGRGRNKVRSGRGRPGTLKSPTPSKPEEKKLTARAAEVTSRLYKTKSSPSESLRRSGRGKGDDNAKSLSPDVRKPPSPHPSSKPHSPASATTGRKDGVSNSELTTKRKGRSREEWDRPWRTKPESLSRSREDVEDKSIRSEPQDKGRDSWDRPWRHGRTAAEAGRHTRTLTVPRSPLALKKGASSSIPPPAAVADKSQPASAKPKLRKDVSDVKGREIRKPKEPGIKRNIASLNVHSALRVSSAAKTPSSEKRVGSDKLPIKTRIPVKTGAKDTKPKIREKTKTTKGHASRSNEELRSSRHSPVDRRQLSGSDSSLLIGRPHPRSRSWLRMVSSASSLPSVPEAAESESDHEPAPLASEPSMAELVAAVPRRQRRGRRGLTEEEEERRHSEPVGEKWAEALAQYTADIETGLGREGLRRMEIISPTSSQEFTDNTQITQSRESVPDVMNEDSPVCTDTDSSLESVKPESKADTCEQEEEVTPRPSDQAMLNTQTNVGTDNTIETNRSVDTTPIVTPRASDGQELEPSRPDDVLLQQNSLADVGISLDSISSAAVMIVQPESLGDIESDWCDVPTNIARKDSEGCFSTDSLDDSEQDPDSLSQDQPDSSNLVHDTGVSSEHLHNMTDLHTVDVNGFSGISFGDAERLPFHEGHSQLSIDETQVPRAENSPQIGDLQNSELCKNVSDTGQYQDLRKDSLDDVGEEQLDSGIPSAFADNVEASRSDRLQQVSQNNSLPESADFAQLDSTSAMPGNDTSVHVSTVSFTLGISRIPGKGEEIVSPAEPTSKPTASTGAEPSHKPTDDQNEHHKTTTGQDSTPKPSEHNQVPDRDTEPTPTGSEIPIEAARASAEGPGEFEARSSRVSEVGSVPVEMLTWLAEEEGSQLSDEALSSSRVKEQIQAWQEVLQQLSPRTSGAVQGIGSAIGAAAHSGSGRRGKRRQHTRVAKGSDSDHAEHFSDDSLASGAHSHPSSRPGSGSRRRRRPANKPTETVVKKRRGHSSEEYVTSDNDSIFSDDSLTQSSERQETPSQVSDLRASVEQLASSLKSSEMAEAESDQVVKDDGMEEDRKASVPVLVSYFESQMKHQENDDSNGEQTPRKRMPDRSPRSVCSDEGNSSASEGTKTARVRGVMARSPICVLNAGDANNLVSDDVSKDVCETENIQEESNYRERPQQSWKLSITPTNTWQSPSAPEEGEGTVEEERSDSPRKRRNSKVDRSASPERRERQDKLTDLHSKYGLMDELDHLSEDNKSEDSLQDTQAEDADLQDDAVRMESSTHRKSHISKVDDEGKMRFEVTINKDETNVLYNVEKTEYQTYALRDRESSVKDDSSCRPIPDTININLTKTTTHQRENRSETITKERILFQGHEGDEDNEDGVIVIERKFAGKHTLDFEQDRKGDMVSRESSSERRLTDEDSNTSLRIKDVHNLNVDAQSSLASTETLLTQSSDNAQTGLFDNCRAVAHIELTSSTSTRDTRNNSEQRGSNSPGQMSLDEVVKEHPLKVDQNSHESRQLVRSSLEVTLKSNDSGVGGGGILRKERKGDDTAGVHVTRTITIGSRPNADRPGTEIAVQKDVSTNEQQVPDSSSSDSSFRKTTAMVTIQADQQIAGPSNKNVVYENDTVKESHPSVTRLESSGYTSHANVYLSSDLYKSDNEKSTRRGVTEKDSLDLDTEYSAVATISESGGGTSSGIHTEGDGRTTHHPELVEENQQQRNVASVAQITLQTRSRQPHPSQENVAIAESTPCNQQMMNNSSEVSLSQNGQNVNAESVSTKYYATALSVDAMPGHADSISTVLPQASVPPLFYSSQSLTSDCSSEQLSGRLTIKSDSSVRTSTADDTFYSPDSTIRSISSSSGSSDYRTPQQSPREFTSPKLAVSPEPDQTYQQSVPFLEMAPREEMPGSASSSVVHDREDGDDMTFHSNQDGSDRSSLLSAMAAAVGRQLLGDEGEMEAMREMLKQEVERKIARLQRRVRSLSDSAISSDFTEPESTSVSPRTSRIPVMDGNVEGLASEAAFYTAAFSQSPQEMFLASKDETDSPHFPLHVNERRKEMLLGKSLEDSGNIHEDQWQDTWTDMLKEEGTQGIDIPKQGRHTVRKYLMPQAVHYGQSLTINNAAYHAESSSPPGSQGQGQQKLSPPHEKVQMYSGLPKDRYFMSPAAGRHSRATLQSTKSYNGSSPASTKHVDLRTVPGQFPERVVDAVLSLEQAWPPPAYASQMLSPRRKGFLQRRTKSLNNLAELAAAQNRSNLEENLLEQARRIMQVARVPSGTDLTLSRRPFGNASGGESVFDHDGVAVEWIDGHFHPIKGKQASFIPHHPQTPSEGISRAWLVSAEKGVLDSSAADFFADDQRLHDAQGLQNRFVARSISDQPERYRRVSGLSDSEEKQMQLASWVSNWDSANPTSNQHSFEPSALSVSGTTSEVGSSTAPSLSDAADTADENIDQQHLYHPQSCDRDSNSLLSSGELEIAGINANAAIRKMHADGNPSQFSTTQTIHSYKDTRIDARSSARSSDTASDFSSPRRWDLTRCRRLRPRSSSSSMRERRFSPGELVLPERTVEWLQHARVGLHEDETLDDLLQSSSCEGLDSPEWTAAQLNMLQCKSMSITNLGEGRYMDEDHEQELSSWELNRPASLACLEGLVMDDTSEDVDSSSDSICIVFMDQRNAETAAQLRAFGGSFTTSEGSERVISHSQSTDSISRCGHLEKFMPPLSEHSASLNNIYEAIASNVQRKGQLHRSRSASLLDVGATPVCEDDLDENIFPPSVNADSQTSLEKATNALVAAELSSHGACLDSRPVYADGSMSVTACIKQVLAYSENDVERTEHYLSMSSPPELYSNRRTGYTNSPHTQSSAEAAELCQTSQEDRIHQRSDFMVVESDQPFIRYRLPDTELQQSESGAETEKEVSPRFYRHSISNDRPLFDSVNQQAGYVSPVKRSQSTGSLETLQLNSGETSPVSIQQRRLPLSPKSKEWVELSHLMLETTHILQNLQQTFPPQPASRWSSDGSQASPDRLRASPPASHNVLASSVMPTETGDQRMESAQTVETETRSSSLHSEQITTQQSPSRWHDSRVSEKSGEPKVKVESVITQTGPSLEKLMTAESGPHTKLTDARARLSMSEVRLETVEASSSAERTNLAEMISQTDDQYTTHIRSSSTVPEDLSFGDIASQSDQTFVQVLDRSDMDRRSQKINSQNVRCQTDEEVVDHLRGTDENLESQRTVEITCHTEEVDVPAHDDRLMKDVDRNENTQYLNMECQTDDLSLNSSVHEMKTDTRYRMEDASSTDIQDKTDTLVETYILEHTTMNGIETKEQTTADSTCQTEGVCMEEAFSLSRDSGSHLKERVVADNTCQTEEGSVYHSVPGMKDGSSSTVDDLSSADFTCQADRTFFDHDASRNMTNARSTADAALDSADLAIQTEIDTEHRIPKDTRDTSSSPIEGVSLSDSTCQTDKTNTESPVSKELMESACNTEGLQSSEMMCQTDETPAEGAVLKAVKDASSSMDNTEVADTTSQTDQLPDVPEQTLITDTSFKTLSTVSLDVICQTDDVEYGAHRPTKDATSSMEDLQSSEISCQTDDTHVEDLTPQLSREGGAAVYDASVTRTTNQDRNLPATASLEQLSEDVSTGVGDASRIEDSGYNSSIKVKPDDDSDSEETYFFEETYVIETYTHPALAQTETSEAESTNQPVLKQKETYETESTSQPELTGSNRRKRETIITDIETTVTTNTVTHTDDHTPESHKRRTENIDSETTVVTLNQSDRPDSQRETKDASSGTTSPLHTLPQTIGVKQDAYDESTVTTNTWIQVQRPSTMDTTCQTEQSDGHEDQSMNQKTADSRILADRLQMSEITSQTEMYPKDTQVAKDTRNASSGMESSQTSEKTSQTDVDVRKTKDVSSSVRVDVREFTSQTDAVERDRSTSPSRENKDAEVSTNEHKELTESVCQTDEVLSQWSERREVDHYLREESKTSAEMPTQTEKDAYALQQEEMKNADSQTLNRSFSNAVCQTDTETLSQGGSGEETITNTESQVPSSFSETTWVTTSVVRSKELQASFEEVTMEECACQTDSLLQENGILNDLSDCSPAQDAKHKTDMVNTTCQTEEAPQILSSNMADENDQEHHIQSDIVSDAYKTKTFDTEDRQYWYDSMSSDEYSEETVEFSTEPRQKPVSVCTQLSLDYPSLCIAVHDKDLGDDDSDDVLSPLQLSPCEDGLHERVDTEDWHAAYRSISAHLPLEMLDDDARVQAETALLEQEHDRAYPHAEPRHAGVEQSDPMTPVSACVHDYVKSVTASWAQSGPGAVVDSKEQELDSDTSAINTPVAEDLRREVPVGGQRDQLDIEMLQSESGDQMTVTSGPTTVFDHQNQPLTPGSDSQDLARQNEYENPSASVASYQRHLTDQTLSRMSNRKIPEGSPRLSEKKKGEFTESGTLPLMVDSLTTDEDDERFAEDSTASRSTDEEVGASSIAGWEYALPFTDAPNVTISQRFTIYEHSWESDSPSTTEIGEHSALSLLPGPEITTQSHVLIDSSSQALPQSEISMGHDLPYSSLQNTITGSEDLSKDSQQSFPQTEQTVFEKSSEPTSVMKAGASSQITSSVSVTSGPLSQTVSENRQSSDQEMHKQAEELDTSTEGSASEFTGQQDAPVTRQLQAENDPTLETGDSATTSWTMSGPSVFVDSPVGNVESSNQEMHKQAGDQDVSTEASSSTLTGEQDAPVTRQLQAENDPTLETGDSATTSWTMSGPSLFVSSPVSNKLSSDQEMHKQAKDQHVSTEGSVPRSRLADQQDAPLIRQLEVENDPKLETIESVTSSWTMPGPSVLVSSPVGNAVPSDQEMHKQAEELDASTEASSSKLTGQQDAPATRQLKAENDPTLETADSVNTSWTMSGPSVFVSSPVSKSANQEMHKQAEELDMSTDGSASTLTGEQDAPVTRQLQAENDPTLETTDSVTTSWTMSGPSVLVDSPVTDNLSSNQEIHKQARDQGVSAEGGSSKLTGQQDAPVTRQLQAENDPTLETADSVTTSWTMSGPSVLVDSSVDDMSSHTTEFVSAKHGETRHTESSKSPPENQRTFTESGDVDTVSRDHHDASGEKSEPRDEAIHVTRHEEGTNALYDSRNRVDELISEEQLAGITEIEYQESVPFFLTQVSDTGSQQQVEREMSYKHENNEDTADTIHTSNVITIESGPSFTTHTTSTSTASAGQEITVDDQDDRKDDFTSNAGLRKESDLRYLTSLEGETKATYNRKKRTTALNSEDQMAITEHEQNISSDDSYEEAEGELSYRRDEKIEETREILRQDRHMVLESGPSVTAHTPPYKASADQEITTNDEDSYGDLPDGSQSRERHREYGRIPDRDKNKEGELSFKRDETVEESPDVIRMEGTKTVEKGPAIGADSTFPGESSVDPAISTEQDQHRYRHGEHRRDTERHPDSDEDVEGELTFKRDEKIEKTHDTMRPDRGMHVDDKPIIIVRPTSPLENDTDEDTENDYNEEEFVNRSRKSRRRDGGELSYYRHDTMEERPRPQLAVLTLHGERQLPASTVDDVLSPEPQEERSEYPVANVSDTNRLSPYSASETSRIADSTLYVRELPEVPLPRQSDIMNEIEKLREEHNRMMLLLERSRHHPSPLLNRLYRARSASPCLMHGGSWSSSSSSPVTVIAGFGSVRGSPVTFISSQSPRLPISGLVTGSGEESGENAFHGSGLKRHSIATTTAEDSVDLTMGGEWQPTLTHSTLPGFMLTTSTPDLRSETHLGESDGVPLSSSSNSGSVIRPLAVYGHVDNTSSQKEHRLSVTQTSTDSSAVHKELSKQSPRNTQAQSTDAQRDVKEEKTKRSFTVHNRSPRGRSISEHQSRTDERFSTDEYRSYHMSEYRSVMSYDFVDNLFVRAEDMEMSQPPLDTRHDSSIVGIQPSYSTARRDDDTSVVASPRSDFHQQDHDRIVSQIVSSFQGNYDAVSSLHESFVDDDITPDFLIQTPRSLGGENVPPLDHQLAASPSLISKGVEAVVNSSDDFTQTDAEDDSLHLSLMDTSRSSLMSSGTTETFRIRAELDRLHQERVEIIELLSLKYLPGSLTVELLEAKLNYCLGQTDMLLASLEKAWAEEEPSDLSRQWSKKHEELLSEYRQQFQQSRQDIKVCMEEARRMQHGTRGRRVARTRDLIAMNRRAQIEAFKHERKREQDWYDRHRNISPDLSDSRTDAGSSSKFAPRFMTPRQHKEHLVRLRRSLVAASTEELDRLRRLSHSSSVSPSPDRSVSPASNVFQSRESSLSTSLSPDRPPPSSNLNSQSSVSFSTPSLVTPAAYSSSELQSSTAHSTSSLHVSSSPPRAPTQIPPTEPMHYRGPSIPRHPKSYLAPRSSSCGPAVSRDVVIPPLVAPPLGHHVAPPLGHQVGPPLGHQEHHLTGASPLSGSRDSLDPEQLLQESYAARQLNRQQISKAHEALKLLEEHRHGFHSQIRSQERRRPRQGLRRQNPRDVMCLPTHTSTRFSEQVIQQEIANLQQQRMQSPEESTALDSGVMSFSLQESVNSNVPPDSTSTPRTHESFESYSTDAAMHTERHVQITLTQHTTRNATDLVRRETDSSFERSEVSTSDTPSSLLSTDLDSFLDLSTSSSLQQSSSHFSSSRPISSQDIKARIARRAKEKAAKGKE